MKQRIIIIEDNITHYQIVSKELSQYDVIVYPKDEEEFYSFADVLTRYGKTGKQEHLGRIEKIIVEFKPTQVIIDLGLDYDNKSDKSGINVKKIIDEKFPDAKQYIMSIFSEGNFGGELNYDGWINKDGTLSIPSQLMKNVIIPGKFVPLPGRAQPSKNRFDRPKLLENLGIFENYKFSPWITFTIDILITYAFYFLIGFLFYKATITLYEKIWEWESAIQIAEYIFIAFLPFLIVAGFFIFYKRSLSPYILKQRIDAKKEDFDSSGKLMTLTKKLFISSLISYLFIRLIELLFLDEQMESKIAKGNGHVPGESITPASPFKEFYHDNYFNQIYFLSGLIIVLIVYYLLIDRKHQTNK
jgi:hypothetical protein